MLLLACAARAQQQEEPRPTLRGVVVETQEGTEVAHRFGAGLGFLQKLLGRSFAALYSAGKLGGSLKRGHIARQSSGYAACQRHNPQKHEFGRRSPLAR